MYFLSNINHGYIFSGKSHIVIITEGEGRDRAKCLLIKSPPRANRQIPRLSGGSLRQPPHECVGKASTGDGYYARTFPTRKEGTRVPPPGEDLSTKRSRREIKKLQRSGRDVPRVPAISARVLCGAQ